MYLLWVLLIVIIVAFHDGQFLQLLVVGIYRFGPINEVLIGLVIFEEMLLLLWQIDSELDIAFFNAIFVEKELVFGTSSTGIILNGFNDLFS